MSILIAISLIPQDPIDHLQVTFLSVGEADSTVLNAQGNTFVLDCGKDNSITADFLTGHGAKVSGIFITHADADHYGGGKDILRRYRDAVVYLPVSWTQMNIGDDLYAMLEGRSIVYLQAGETVTLSEDVYAEVLWPPADFSIKDDNSGSLILHVVYNDYSLLMMSDLSDRYDTFACVESDLIKIAHHGSKNATSADMLNTVAPHIAVISVGSNGYGHPASETLQRLEAINAEIYRTDELGAITIDIFEDGSTAISTVLIAEE